MSTINALTGLYTVPCPARGNADDLATELASLATARIRRGEWPWSFFW